MKLDTKWKILPIINAVLMIILGLWMIIKPSTLANNIAVILGTIMLLVGVLQVVYAIATREYAFLPGTRMALGIIAILLGIIFIVQKDISQAIITVIFGIWAMTSGVIKISGAIQRANLRLPWGWEVLTGLIFIAFAFLLIFRPIAGFTIWTIFAGCYFLATAIDTIVSIMFIDKIIKETKKVIGMDD